VSCEVALNPSLRGKPVVTGAERGIVSALSYEAKAKGIKRGMPIHQVRQLVPDVVVMPGDYETYALYSQRMYEIVRRYTPQVEEYSIDECFADITGLRGTLHKTYEAIALEIKRELQNELGITFSVGLASSNSLAKLGSKYQKPDGFTYIREHDREKVLALTPIETIWGIGPQTSIYLDKLGIKTAYDFVAKSEAWMQKSLNKPHQEMWRELGGESIWKVATGSKRKFVSISKTRTFTKPSRDRGYILSRLIKNIENACVVARRHGREARKVSFFLKGQARLPSPMASGTGGQDFRFRTFEVKLDTATNLPSVLSNIVRDNFSTMYKDGVIYRATGVTLSDIRPLRPERQTELFGGDVQVTKMFGAFKVVDDIAKRFGKHTLHLASTLGQHTRGNFIKAASKPFGIPMLGEVK